MPKLKAERFAMQFRRNAFQRTLLFLVFVVVVAAVVAGGGGGGGGAC